VVSVVALSSYVLVLSMKFLSFVSYVLVLSMGFFSFVLFALLNSWSLVSLWLSSLIYICKGTKRKENINLTLLNILNIKLMAGTHTNTYKV
jgi:hypothetical protein